MATMILCCGVSASDVMREVRFEKPGEGALGGRELGGRQLGERELGEVRTLSLSAVPTRKELKELDEVAAKIFPKDPTPSLADIQAQPEVAYQGAPEFAPQREYLTEELRVIVVAPAAGLDAALSAVVTRLMRADKLWVEVACVALPGPAGESLGAADASTEPTASAPPTASARTASAPTASTAAKNFGIAELPLSEQWQLALFGQVRPVPLIRNDSGVAVVGSATVMQAADPNAAVQELEEFTGEVIVDDHVLLRNLAEGKAQLPGVYGARLVPMLDAPGIAAVRATTPVEDTPAGLWSRLRGKKFIRGGQVDPETLVTGRALQAGGPRLAVTVDGVKHKRTLERVTFYRHLRDLQMVRP